MVEYGPQGKDVSEPAESCDPADHHILDHGLSPKGLPAGKIAQVDLDSGKTGKYQGVAYRHARMGIPTEIEHQSVGALSGFLEAGHDFPLVIGLEKRNRSPFPPGGFGYIVSDFVQGLLPVHRWFPLPEDVEVRSVEEKDPVRRP
jgi:hypothetical protein